MQLDKNLLELLQIMIIQTLCLTVNWPLIYNKVELAEIIHLHQRIVKLSIGEEMILYRKVHLLVELIKVGPVLIIQTGQ